MLKSYNCRVADAKGDNQIAVIEGNNEAEVIQHLRSMGYYPISVVPVYGSNEISEPVKIEEPVESLHLGKKLGGIGFLISFIGIFMYFWPGVSEGTSIGLALIIVPACTIAVIALTAIVLWIVSQILLFIGQFVTTVLHITTWISKSTATKWIETIKAVQSKLLLS